MVDGKKHTHLPERRVLPRYSHVPRLTHAAAPRHFDLLLDYRAFASLALHAALTDGYSSTTCVRGLLSSIRTLFRVACLSFPFHFSSLVFSNSLAACIRPALLQKPHQACFLEAAAAAVKSERRRCQLHIGGEGLAILSVAGKPGLAWLAIILICPVLKHAGQWQGL